MEITLEKKSRTSANLKIQLKENDYRTRVNQKVKEYSKTVSIKGFRPGKVPFQLVDKLYGKTILTEEIYDLLHETVNKYLKENNITIVGQPVLYETPTDWENTKDFQFAYELGIVPEFSIPNPEKFKIEKFTIIPEDSIIDETLNNLRKQFGKMQEAELSSKEDFLKGKLTEMNGSYNQDTLLPVSKVAEAEQHNFIGRKVGDTIEFDLEKVFEKPEHIQYVTGLNKEEALNKKGKFVFTISSIHTTVPAELNQEFFDKVFGAGVVQSEEDFNSKLRETIFENYLRESQYKMYRDLRKCIITNTAIELPHEFLKKWFSFSFNQLPQDEVEKEYIQYVDELKWYLIKNKIAEKESISLTYEQIHEHVMNEAANELGIKTITDELREYVKKIADKYLMENNGKNFMTYYEKMLENKILDWAESKATIKEKKVTVKEFRKIISEKNN